MPQLKMGRFTVVRQAAFGVSQLGIPARPEQSNFLSHYPAATWILQPRLCTFSKRSDTKQNQQRKAAPGSRQPVAECGPPGPSQVAPSTQARHSRRPPGAAAAAGHPQPPQSSVALRLCPLCWQRRWTVACRSGEVGSASRESGGELVGESWLATSPLLGAPRDGAIAAPHIQVGCCSGLRCEVWQDVLLQKSKGFRAVPPVAQADLIRPWIGLLSAHLLMLVS